MKILILVDFSTEFSRRLFSGFKKFTQKAEQWSIYRISANYRTIYGEEEIIQRAKTWGVDFIIAQWDYLSTSSLKDLEIPVFFQNYKEEGKGFSTIIGNYTETGRMAANFFIQSRFKNFAYYGNKGFIWSMKRAKGFSEEVKKANGNYFYFESIDLNETHEEQEIIQLENWLISLPKPVAIFACDDSFAIQISEICKIKGITIPDDVSLLGVDNDELICNLSDPPISSIILDAEKGGYDLGRKIQRSLQKNEFQSFDITINPVRIEKRKSTEKYNINNEYVLEIVSYIRNNFHLELNINSLVELVPFSRRNLEVKFREEMGVSIYQFIINLRIENIAFLLTSTDLSIQNIIFKSGFNDYSNVYRIFKRTKGYTPIEYRKKYKNNNDSICVSY